MGIRLLFLDMEGTILASQAVVVGPDHAHHTSLWTRIFAELGSEAQRDNVAMIEKWDAGGYPSYMDWVEDSLLAMQRHGLTRAMFDALVVGSPFNDGVAEALAEIHAMGIRTAIVSGGFIAQARRAQAELRIHHAYAATDLFFDEMGRLFHWNVYPSDFEGKVDFVKLMMREYRLGADDCAFIGDGANDVPVASTVGTSVAYHAHPSLVEAAHHSIDDFRDLVAILRGA